MNTKTRKNLIPVNAENASGRKHRERYTTSAEPKGSPYIWNDAVVGGKIVSSGLIDSEGIASTVRSLMRFCDSSVEKFVEMTGASEKVVREALDERLKRPMSTNEISKISAVSSHAFKDSFESLFEMNGYRRYTGLPNVWELDRLEYASAGTAREIGDYFAECDMSPTTHTTHLKGLKHPLKPNILKRLSVNAVGDKIRAYRAFVAANYCGTLEESMGRSLADRLSDETISASERLRIEEFLREREEGHSEMFDKANRRFDFVEASDRSRRRVRRPASFGCESVSFSRLNEDFLSKDAETLDFVDEMNAALSEPTAVPTNDSDKPYGIFIPDSSFEATSVSVEEDLDDETAESVVSEPESDGDAESLASEIPSDDALVSVPQEVLVRTTTGMATYAMLRLSDEDGAKLFGRLPEFLEDGLFVKLFSDYPDSLKGKSAHGLSPSEIERILSKFV